LSAGHPRLIRYPGVVLLVAAALTCPRPVSAQLTAQQPAALADTLPAGALLPVRFVHGIVSGRDTVGEPIMLQTMASIDRNGCVMLAPFRPVYARIAESRGGRSFGKGGVLAIATDSLRRRTGVVLPITAILDTLEWLPGNLTLDDGTVRRHRRKALGTAAAPAAAAGGMVLATGGLAIVPVAIVGALSWAWKGGPVSIEAGELASLKLEAPLVIPSVATCRKENVSAMAATEELLASLPHFSPRSTDRSGMVLGDQINFVLLGTRGQVDSAFAAAQWHPRVENTISNEVTGATAVVFNRQSSHVAFSNAYYDGRVEDLAFERPGPTARDRHHIRLWSIDSARTIWVGAADEDIGLKMNLMKFEATHRVSPDIDDERDILTRDLEAGGCAAFIGYVHEPGAVTSGVNAWGQDIRSDGRAAVLKVGCRALDDLTR
jgi:hypothetical protein